MTAAGATKFCTGIVSTELFGRSRPLIQWIGASKWVPVCSPHEKLFQYQPGPRSSYCEISSMRNGQHWPISGGSAICGKSGVSVCVRSTTRMRPEASASARVPSSDVSCMSVAPCGQLALEDLGVVAPALEPFLRHLARVHVLEAFLQRVHDRARQGRRRHLRRRQVL